MGPLVGGGAVMYPRLPHHDGLPVQLKGLKSLKLALMLMQMHLTERLLPL